MALLLGSAGLVIAVTMAALSFSQLNLAQVQSNRSQARNAAEAAVHLALAQVLENPDYGKRGQPTALEVIRWTSPGGQSTGNLTFSDYSTNSLSEDAPTQGSRGLVSVHSLQLVGMGSQGGITAKVLVALHIPAYPYAVASSGVFQSGGGLLVGELPAHADPAQLGADPIRLEQTQPGQSGLPLQRRPGHPAQAPRHRARRRLGRGRHRPNSPTGR